MPDSRARRRFTSGNECNVSYVVLHLRYGRHIDIHIRCTAPYSAARETTTSVGLAHARPMTIPLYNVAQFDQSLCEKVILF